MGQLAEKLPLFSNTLREMHLAHLFQKQVCWSRRAKSWPSVINEDRTLSYLQIPVIYCNSNVIFFKYNTVLFSNTKLDRYMLLTQAGPEEGDVLEEVNQVVFVRSCCLGQ